MSQILLGLLESILGKGNPTSRGNVSFVCPFHTSNPPGKKNFEINLITNKNNENPSHCWGCDAKHKTLKSLFNHLKVSQDKYDQLNSILGTTYKINKPIIDLNVELPKEFTPFISLKKQNITARHAINYLQKRGLTYADILKHHIGFCETGKYQNMVIIPSYSSKGKLDYFIARSFEENPSKRIKAPMSDKNIIGFESLINWNLPIIISEGPFDAIAIKRNAIPLFGKIISPKLKNKLMLNKVKSVYLALDKDAIKNTIKIAEELIGLGKKVYVMRMEDKDPSLLGFKEFNNQIQQLKPFSLMDLMKLKMEIK
jgi:DNA primase